MLTLLTATGCRPKAWSICEQLMMRQTYQGPVHWIVVDDGEDQQPITFKRNGWHLTVIRPHEKWKEGQNTQARNLRFGLDLVEPDDRLVVIEDDDFYANDWLDVVDHHLDSAELVGEIMARYYNITTKTGRQLHNNNHASLCATAMRGAAIETFKRVCTDNVTFIDIDLWKQPNSKMLFMGNRVVGIKGLPGRTGIGMGHKSDFTGTKDSTMELLRSWIGDDVRLYG